MFWIKTTCQAGKNMPQNKIFSLTCILLSHYFRVVMKRASVRVTLMEHMDTTHDKLVAANHKPGPGCRCKECGKLKSLEDKWICRMGTYHGRYGLNDRCEITNKVRGQYWRYWYGWCLGSVSCDICDKDYTTNYIRNHHGITHQFLLGSLGYAGFVAAAQA